MFYLGWIALTATGVLVSIAVFVWAVRSGQFSDQGRARFLPLSDEIPNPRVADPSKLSIEVYVLMGVFGMGVLAMASTIALILFRVRG